MYAVILTGGKQYRVKEGDLVSVEKLEVEVGSKVVFDKVLLLEGDSKITVGAPEINGAVVTAEVVENFRDDKILVFKKKRRKQFRRTRGHRQDLTKVKIESFQVDGKTLAAAEVPAPAKAEKPAPAPEKVEAVPEAPKAAKPKKTVKAAEEAGQEPKKAPARKPAAKKEAVKE